MKIIYYRLITYVLVVSFLYSNIVWAYTDSLQPNSAFDRDPRNRGVQTEMAGEYNRRTEGRGISIEQVYPKDWRYIKKEILKVQGVLPEGLRQSERDLARSFGDKKAISLVARKEGRIIGYITGASLEDFGYIPGIEDDENYRLGNTFYIEQLAVLDDRDRGEILDSLLNGLISKAKEKKYNFVYGHAPLGKAPRDAETTGIYRDFYGTGVTYVKYRFTIRKDEEEGNLLTKEAIRRRLYKVEKEIEKRLGAKRTEGDEDEDEPEWESVKDIYDEIFIFENLFSLHPGLLKIFKKIHFLLRPLKRVLYWVFEPTGFFLLILIFFDAVGSKVISVFSIFLWYVGIRFGLWLLGSLHPFFSKLNSKIKFRYVFLLIVLLSPTMRQEFINLLMKHRILVPVFILTYPIYKPLSFISQAIQRIELKYLLRFRDYRKEFETHERTVTARAKMRGLGLNEKWDNPDYRRIYRIEGGEVASRQIDYIELARQTTRRFLGYRGDDGKPKYEDETGYLLKGKKTAIEIRKRYETYTRLIKEGKARREDVIYLFTEIRNNYVNPNSEGIRILDEVIEGVAAGAELLTGEVQAEIWKRDPYVDLSYEREFYCCAFLGGIMDQAAFGYLDNPAITMLDFRRPDKGRILRVIMGAGVFYEGGVKRTVLVVDSVEGTLGLDRAVIRQAIEDYARAVGFYAVMYNSHTYNQVPKKFLEHLKEGGVPWTSIDVELIDHSSHEYFESFHKGFRKPRGTVEGYFMRLEKPKPRIVTVDGTNFTIQQVFPEDWGNIKRGIMKVEKVFPRSLRQDAEDLGNTFEDPNSITLVLKQGDEIIGYIAGGPLEDYDYLPGIEEDRNCGRRNTVYIESFAIIKEYQKQGLGSGLRKTFLELAKLQGYEYVSGHVRKGIAEKRGDEVLSIHRNWRDTRKIYEYYRGRLSDPDAISINEALKELDTFLSGRGILQPEFVGFGWEDERPSRGFIKEHLPEILGLAQEGKVAVHRLPDGRIRFTRLTEMLSSTQASSKVYSEARLAQELYKLGYVEGTGEENKYIRPTRELLKLWEDAMTKELSSVFVKGYLIRLEKMGTGKGWEIARISNQATGEQEYYVYGVYQRTEAKAGSDVVRTPPKVERKRVEEGPKEKPGLTNQILIAFSQLARPTLRELMEFIRDEWGTETDEKDVLTRLGFLNFRRKKAGQKELVLVSEEEAKKTREAKPEEPAEPVKPKKPLRPVKPGKPEKPAKPPKPAKPAKPSAEPRPSDLVKKDKAELVRKLAELNWNLKKFHDYIASIIGRKKPHFLELLRGLDLVEEFKAEALRIFRQNKGMINKTSEYFGITDATFRALVVDFEIGLNLPVSEEQKKFNSIVLSYAEELKKGTPIEEIREKLGPLIEEFSGWEVDAEEGEIKTKFMGNNTLVMGALEDKRYRIVFEWHVEFGLVVILKEPGRDDSEDIVYDLSNCRDLDSSGQHKKINALWKGKRKDFKGIDLNRIIERYTRLLKEERTLPQIKEELLKQIEEFGGWEIEVARRTFAITPIYGSYNNLIFDRIPSGKLFLKLQWDDLIGLVATFGKSEEDAEEDLVFDVSIFSGYDESATRDELKNNFAKKIGVRDELNRARLNKVILRYINLLRAGEPLEQIKEEMALPGSWKKTIEGNNFTTTPVINNVLGFQNIPKGNYEISLEWLDTVGLVVVFHKEGDDRDSDLLYDINSYKNYNESAEKATHINARKLGIRKIITSAYLEGLGTIARAGALGSEQAFLLNYLGEIILKYIDYLREGKTSDEIKGLLTDDIEKFGIRELELKAKSFSVSPVKWNSLLFLGLSSGKYYISVFWHDEYGLLVGLKPQDESDKSMKTQIYNVSPYKNYGATEKERQQLVASIVTLRLREEEKPKPEARVRKVKTDGLAKKITPLPKPITKGVTTLPQPAIEKITLPPETPPKIKELKKGTKAKFKEQDCVIYLDTVLMPNNNIYLKFPDNRIEKHVIKDILDNLQIYHSKKKMWFLLKDVVETVIDTSLREEEESPDQRVMPRIEEKRYPTLMRLTKLKDPQGRVYILLGKRHGDTEEVLLAPDNMLVLKPEDGGEIVRILVRDAVMAGWGILEVSLTEALRELDVFLNQTGDISQPEFVGFGWEARPSIEFLQGRLPELLGLAVERKIVAHHMLDGRIRFTKLAEHLSVRKEPGASRGRLKPAKVILFTVLVISLIGGLFAYFFKQVTHIFQDKPAKIKVVEKDKLDTDELYYRASDGDPSAMKALIELAPKDKKAMKDVYLLAYHGNPSALNFVRGLALNGDLSALKELDFIAFSGNTSVKEFLRTLDAQIFVEKNPNNDKAVVEALWNLADHYSNPSAWRCIVDMAYKGKKDAIEKVYSRALSDYPSAASILVSLAYKGHVELIGHLGTLKHNNNPSAVEFFKSNPKEFIGRAIKGDASSVEVLATLSAYGNSYAKKALMTMNPRRFTENASQGDPAAVDALDTLYIYGNLYAKEMFKAINPQKLMEKALGGDKGAKKAVEFLANRVVLELRWDHFAGVSDSEVGKRLEAAAHNNAYFLYACFNSEENFGALASIIFRRLDAEAGKGGRDFYSFLRDMDPNRIFYGDFILQLANFSLLDDILSTTQSLYEVMDFLFRDLSSEQLKDYGVRLALFVEAVTSDSTFRYQRDFQVYLRSLYERAKGVNQYLAAVLLTAYKDTLNFLSAGDISAIAGRHGIVYKEADVPYGKLFRDSGLVVHIVFADYEAVRDSFGGTLNFFKGNGYKLIKRGKRDTVLEKGNIQIVLVKADGYRGGYDIDKYLDRVGIISSRSHAGNEWDVFKMQEKPKDSEGRIFIISSCRSATKLGRISGSYPNVSLIGINGTGSGRKTDQVIYWLLEALNRRIPTFKGIKNFIRTNAGSSVVEDYVFPEDSSLRVHRLVSEYVSRGTGQIGKRAHIAGVEGDIARVRDSKGDIHKIELTGQKLDLSMLALALSLSFARKRSGNGAWAYLAMLGEFQKKTVRFNTFSTLIEDLFGFASGEHNLIAVHESLANNPIAVFHEISEYLIKMQILKLKMQNKNLIISISDNEYTVVLDAEALSIAQKGPDNSHYLLRALQRQVFGERDRELTERIKAGQCVTGDTLLPVAAVTSNQKPETRKYSLKPIVDVKPGDYVLSLNEQTQQIEPHRIKGLLDMGIKPVYKLTTVSGRTIKTTANHPYLTRHGWVKVSGLSAGNNIAVSNVHGNDAAYGRDSGQSPRQSIQRLYRLIELVEQLKPYYQSSFVSLGQLINPKINDSVITEYIHNFITKLKSRKKPLTPPATIISLNISKDVLEIISRRFLWNMGILLNKVYYAMGFVSRYFLDEAEAAEIGRDIIWDRIVSIEYIGYEHVYDVEVEGTHNFIGNGIFAHNTYIGDGRPTHSKSPKGSEPFSERDKRELVKMNKDARYFMLSQAQPGLFGAVKKSIRASYALEDGREIRINRRRLKDIKVIYGGSEALDILNFGFRVNGKIGFAYYELDPKTGDVTVVLPFLFFASIMKKYVDTKADIGGKEDALKMWMKRPKDYPDSIRWTKVELQKVKWELDIPIAKLRQAVLHELVEARNPKTDEHMDAEEVELIDTMQVDELMRGRYKGKGWEYERGRASNISLLDQEIDEVCPVPIESYEVILLWGELRWNIDELRQVLGISGLGFSMGRMGVWHGVEDDIEAESYIAFIKGLGIELEFKRLASMFFIYDMKKHGKKRLSYVARCFGIHDERVFWKILLRLDVWPILKEIIGMSRKELLGQLRKRDWDPDWIFSTFAKRLEAWGFGPIYNSVGAVIELLDLIDFYRDRHVYSMRWWSRASEHRRFTDEHIGKTHEEVNSYFERLMSRFRNNIAWVRDYSRKNLYVPGNANIFKIIRIFRLEELFRRIILEYWVGNDFSGLRTANSLNIGGTVIHQLFIACGITDLSVLTGVDKVDYLKGRLKRFRKDKLVKALEVKKEKARDAFKRLITEGMLDKYIKLFGLKGAYRLIFRMFKDKLSEEELFGLMREQLVGLDFGDVEKVIGIRREFSFFKARELDLPKTMERTELDILTDEVISTVYKNLVRDHRFLDRLRGEGENTENPLPLRDAYKRTYRYYKDAVDFNVQGLMPGVVLRLFQKVGVKFLIEKKRAVLADEMGTGKTLEAIAACLNIPGAKKVLVIVPNSAKNVWEREIRTKTRERAAVLRSGKREEFFSEAGDARFLVINYEAIGRRDRTLLDRLLAINFDVIIYDEAHKLRNENLYWKAVSEFKAEYEFGLTGTPLVGRDIAKAFNLNHKLYPDRFPGRRGFKKKYSYTRRVGDVERIYYRIRQYHTDVKDFTLRRLKRDVLPDLPPKRFITVPVRLSKEHRKVYEGIYRDFRNWLMKYVREEKRPAKPIVLTKYLMLKQAAIDLSLVGQDVPSAKYEELDRLVEMILNRGEKILIYTTYVEVVDKLRERYVDKGICFLKGGMTNVARQRQIDLFQQEPRKRLMISTFTESVTLTAANNVIFVDKPWTPQERDQAIDRVHRFGQTRPVNIYTLMAEDTVDERTERILREGEVLFKLAIEDFAEMSEGEEEVIQGIIREEKEVKDLVDFLRNKYAEYGRIEELRRQRIKPFNRISVDGAAIYLDTKNALAGNLENKELLREFFMKRMDYEISANIGIKESFLWPIFVELIPILGQIDFHGQLEFEVELAMYVVYSLIKDEELTTLAEGQRPDVDLDKVLYMLDRYNVFKTLSGLGVLGSRFYYLGKILDYKHPGQEFSGLYHDADIVGAIGLEGRDAEIRLARESGKGNISARDALISANLWLVREIAKGEEELVAEGNKELVNILGDYLKIYKDVSFSEYARPLLQEALSKYSRARAREQRVELTILDVPVFDDGRETRKDRLVGAEGIEVEEEPELIRIARERLIEEGFSNEEIEIFLKSVAGYEIDELAMEYSRATAEIEEIIKRAREILAKVKRLKEAVREAVPARREVWVEGDYGVTRKEEPEEAIPVREPRERTRGEPFARQKTMIRLQKAKDFLLAHSDLRLELEAHPKRGHIIKLIIEHRIMNMDKTQEELGQMVGVTKARIGQIEKWILDFVENYTSPKAFPAGRRDSKMPALEELQWTGEGIMLDRDVIELLINRFRDGSLFSEDIDLMCWALFIEENLSSNKLQKLLLLSFINLLHKLKDRPELASLFFNEILGTNANIGKNICIRVAKNLPVNSVRYYDKERGLVVIAIDSRFLDALLRYWDEKGYRDVIEWFLTERIFIHELSHDNRISARKEELEEEADIIRTKDLVFYREICYKDPEFIRRIDGFRTLIGVSEAARSGGYFGFLYSLAQNGEGRLAERIKRYVRRNYLYGEDIGPDLMAGIRLRNRLAEMGLKKKIKGELTVDDMARLLDTERDDEILKAFPPDTRFRIHYTTLYIFHKADGFIRLSPMQKLRDPVLNGFNDYRVEDDIKYENRVRIRIYRRDEELSRLGDLQKRFQGIPKDYLGILYDVNEREEVFSGLGNDELRYRVMLLKDRISGGERIEDVLVEALVLFRVASRRAIDMRPYDEQVLGAIGMVKNNAVEMLTGEGKTLAIAMASFIMSLMGEGVHIATFNEYLAKRDILWMGPIFDLLGVKAGLRLDRSHTYLYSDRFNTNGSRLKKALKRDAYLADITYGSANVFVFDFEQDSMALNPEEKAQRELSFAIVDEGDSILIDEAFIPLSLSIQIRQFLKKSFYYEMAGLVNRLVKGVHYNVDTGHRSVSVVKDAIRELPEYQGLRNKYKNIPEIIFENSLRQALRAKELVRLDMDYIVEDGRLVIIDAFTGRPRYGYIWGEGLHQAVEAKEGLAYITFISRSLTTMTKYRYFKMYRNLSCTSGTIGGVKILLSRWYRLNTIEIPPNKPVQRKEYKSKWFKTKEEKFRAVVEEVERMRKKGRPVLVGTRTIKDSETLSRLLSSRHIPHKVLNGRNLEEEAEIVAQAGQAPDGIGNVTIVTNLAGRGTDIKLGAGVNERGGLHVIGTEYHENIRVDDQLRGRAGRQGDNGSCRFFLSEDDYLIKRFTREGKHHLGAINKMRHNAKRDLFIRARLDGIFYSYQARFLRFRERFLNVDTLKKGRISALINGLKGEMDGKECSNRAMDVLIEVLALEEVGFKQIPARKKLVRSVGLGGKEKLLEMIDLDYETFLFRMQTLIDRLNLIGLGEEDKVGLFTEASRWIFSKFVEELEMDISGSETYKELAEVGISLPKAKLRAFNRAKEILEKHPSVRSKLEEDPRFKLIIEHRIIGRNKTLEQMASLLGVTSREGARQIENRLVKIIDSYGELSANKRTLNEKTLELLTLQNTIIELDYPEGMAGFLYFDVDKLVSESRETAQAYVRALVSLLKTGQQTKNFTVVLVNSHCDWTFQDVIGVLRTRHLEGVDYLLENALIIDANEIGDNSGSVLIDRAYNKANRRLGKVPQNIILAIFRNNLDLYPVDLLRRYILLILSPQKPGLGEDDVRKLSPYLPGLKYDKETPLLPEIFCTSMEYQTALEAEKKIRSQA